MKKNNILVIFILLSIFYGCDNKDNTQIKKINNFPSNRNVSTVNIQLLGENLIDYPVKIIKKDSLLFLLDIGNTSDYFVHCYSFPNCQYIQSFFKHGQGPDEFISINNIQIYRDTLYAYNSTNEIFFIPLDNFLRKSLKLKKYKMSSDYGFLNRGCKIKESFFFPVFNKLNKNRILEFKMNGELKSSFGKLTTNLSEINEATYQAYMPFLHGKDSILVAATQFGEVLDIYNIHDHKQITIVGKKGYPEFQNINGFAINKGIIGYEDVQVTNNRIYALFNGENEKDKKFNRQGGKYIYVFSLDGLQLIKLTIDRRCIGFFVDEDNQKIYLLDVNSDEPLFSINL